MKTLSAKSALNMLILGLVTSLSVILGSSLVPVTSVQATAEDSRPQPEPIVVYYQAQAGTPAGGANAGLLLQASGDKVYYLTEEGRRRLFYDRQTFRAFDFAEENIIRVADDFMAAPKQYPYLRVSTRGTPLIWRPWMKLGIKIGLLGRPFTKSRLQKNRSALWQFHRKRCDIYHYCHIVFCVKILEIQRYRSSFLLYHLRLLYPLTPSSASTSDLFQLNLSARILSCLVSLTCHSQGK